MTNSRDLILKLKEVKERDGLSLSEIEALTEKNGEHVSKTTLSRVFADGSENTIFKFENTLKPIANAILDVDNIEDDDTLDTQALKLMLKIKADRIRELEAELDHSKVKHNDKVDKIRAEHQKRVDFLIKQIDIKDKRIDLLMGEVFRK